MSILTIDEGESSSKIQVPWDQGEPFELYLERCKQACWKRDSDRHVEGESEASRGAALASGGGPRESLSRGGPEARRRDAERLSPGVEALLDRGRSRKRAAGLDNAAISGRELGSGLIDVLPGGLRCSFNLPVGSKVGHWRDKIRGFSAKARHRMMEKMMMVEWAPVIEGTGKRSKKVRGLFATFTYPGEYSPSFEVWKAHLSSLRKRIERGFPSFERAIWKLEFQARGAPHFHIPLMFREPVDVQAFRQWAGCVWYDIVGSGDPKHRQSGTSIDAMYGPVGRLLRYLVKYIGKKVSREEETGKIWDTWGDWPDEPLRSMRVDREMFVRLRRRVRLHGKKSRFLRGQVGWSFLVLGDGRLLEQLLRGLAPT